MEIKAYSADTIINPYPNKAGFNAQREAWEDGFKAGERKVTEWLKRNDNIRLAIQPVFGNSPKKVLLHQIHIWDDEWQAFLKEL